MDKYVRVKKIGEGSFGKALLVKAKENGQQYVVKEINMSRMSKKERDEARKETAVLAQLSHPNIVTYRESFEEIGNLYIVMDYCEGGDLYGKINMQRGILFQENQVLDWFVQICLSIKHIHDRKILHRDIKSQNIFITRHGIVKLGDFGIAKVLNSTVELARTCIGTPYYLSPEICENKPYNNKSDIWSLGCVLYELTTLKHAFEAGNMKNLVLKIIRGSYPPVSPKYSYEIRNLIAVLFKRNARDRPSINNVLRKPLLQKRIQKFLTDSELNDEFSHTVLHGQKIRKALLPGQNKPAAIKPSGQIRPSPAKVNVVAAKKPPSTPRYDPASVYGPSVARKSKDKENRVRRSGDSRKSADANRRSADGKRPPSRGEMDLARKKQELVEKEKARRDAAKLREMQYQKQHKDLIDKQKAARIQKAREEGWKNLMDSIGSEEEEKPIYRAPSPKRNDVQKRLPPGFKPAVPAATPIQDRGNYAQYHAFLDKLDQDRKAAPVPAANPYEARGAPALAGFDPVSAARQGRIAGAAGGAAAERARLVEEFRQRKVAAAMNKNRDVYGGVGAAISARPSPYGAPVVNKPPPGAQEPTSAREAHRRNQEDDYLSRLRQIRLQNFNERRNLQENNKAKADDKYKPSGHNDADLRRKKIEALRAQADERAQRLKAELEKKRQEAHDLDRLRHEQRNRIPEHRRIPEAKPVPAVPMTEAMKAIGIVKGPQTPPTPEQAPVGMTAALNAIGAGPSVSASQEDNSKLNRQKQKEAILKRLNSKPPVPSGGGEQKRPKWGEPVQPTAVSYERPKWGEAREGAGLGKLSLEETASHMEVTSKDDVVITHRDPAEPESARRQWGTPGDEEGPKESARRQWGGPAGTVLNVLQGKTLSDVGDQSLTESEKSLPAEGSTEQNKEAGEPESGGRAPVIGSTITIVRTPGKGTVVIKKGVTQEDSPDNQPKEGDTCQETSEASETSEDKNKEGTKSVLFDKVELDDDEEEENKETDKLEVEDLEEDKPAKEDEKDESKNIKDKPEEDTKVEDEEGEEISPLKKINMKDSGNVLLGLTSGQFDMRDVGMLRTCSEPDLSKLFRAAQEGDAAPQSARSHSRASMDIAALMVISSVEDDLSVEEGEIVKKEDEEIEVEEKVKDEEEDEKDENLEEQKGSEDEKEEEDAESEEGSKSDENTSKSESTEAQEEEEEEEADLADDDEDEEDDDEDLETLRESMMSLLQNNHPSDEEANTVVKKKTKKTTKKVKKKKSKPKKATSEESGEGDAPSVFEREMSNSADEADLMTMRDAMKSILEEGKTGKSPKKVKTPKKESGAGDATDSLQVGDEEIEGATASIVPGKESWQSDSEEEDDFFQEEDDMFSRLEESRAILETELGCDTFLEAYKTVQALHEDEDEDMEEGMRMVSQILGQEKSHLYPNILQLVMADGAFTEGND